MTLIYVPKYYNIKELVSPVVYNKYGNSAWMFFQGDPEYLMDLDFLREEWGSGIYLNTWAFPGVKPYRDEAAYRCNVDDIVRKKRGPYCSGHTMCKAFDPMPANGQYEKFWHFIWALITNGKFKRFNRIEHHKHTVAKGYVHIDSFSPSGKPEVFTIK